EKIDGVHARNPSGAVTEQVARGPFGGGVTAGENEAGQDEEGRDGKIAATDEGVNRRGRRGGGGFQHLAAAGQVMDDDPDSEDEAETRQRGKVRGGPLHFASAWKRPATGGFMQ